MFYYLRFIKYAIEGLTYVITNHKSFTIQCIAGVMVILLGYYLGVSRMEWIILLAAIFAVLGAELLNTAIETTLDYMEKEHHQDVKIAKDVAAGGVLLTAIGAAVVGCVIFFPYLTGLI